MGKYDLDVVKFRLADCVSPDFNPRFIGDVEFERLKESIRRFGYSDPIIVNRRNNHIVAGNQRYRALCELNRENHGKYTFIDVVLVDLDLADEKAFNIGHNKIGGEFDEAKLEVLLDELESLDYDMDLTGFADVLDDVSGDDLDSLVGDVSLEDVAPDVFMVSVTCRSREEQEALFNRLKGEGYSVKSMVY